MLNKLKSSLGAKITCILLLVLVGLLSAAWFFAGKNAEKEMTDYYKQLSRVISDFSSEVIKDYMDDPNQNMDEMEMLGTEIKSLCKDELLDMVFIVKEDRDNFDIGDILMVVLDDTVEIKGIDQYSGTYFLESEEMEIMSGRKDAADIVYDARIGEVISFLYGYDIVNEITGDNTRIIVGSNVTLDIFHSSIGSIMRKLFFEMVLIILFMIIMIRVLVYKIAIVPFKVLSENMKKFIQNNRINFEPLKVKGHDERASVVQSFNIMGEEIQSYIESVNKLEEERQKNFAEIKVASEIQRGLLPNGEYTDCSFKVKGCMVPAQNVGGDLYYYDRLDENRMAFVIGDVSGKGVSAALFMSNIVCAIKYNLRNCSSPAKTIKAMNDDIISHNPNGMFVTLFVGILDAEKHSLTYSNAGHNPPYKIGQKTEPLTGGKGILAGVFADAKYEDAIINFEQKDRIFLYTDGVTEAMNLQKEFFGEKRLESILGSDQENLIDIVLQRVRSFMQGAEQYDDITMMMLGFNEKRMKTKERESIDDCLYAM